MSIVALGKVCPEMCAAALFAPQRGVREQPRDSHEIPVTPLLRRGRQPRYARAVEHFDRRGEAFSGAKQTGVAPHQISDSCHG